MEDDHSPVTVEQTDGSGQIRVAVAEDGLPRLALGIGTKAAIEPPRFAGEVHLLVNQALGAHVASTLARHWRSVAARGADVRQAQAHEPARASVEDRLEAIERRTVETHRRAQEIRSSGPQPESASAGRRGGVWVEVRDGFVSVLEVDEQHYAQRSLDLLEHEINDALAEAVTAAARFGGPLANVTTQESEDRE